MDAFLLDFLLVGGLLAFEPISGYLGQQCLGYAFQCSINPPLASTEHIIGINRWTMEAWHKRTYV
ncbi:hypothetical protein BDA96_08G148500 [Sorghum bicolor]|uniref:Uncharacterized protein n=1 Tax=Sorghum bicolor TaxID=4558 RepID=A0A921QGF3_SORBI|nr:hypothetical protein BDA96_08G148500 [Sorghum bicolor]